MYPKGTFEKEIRFNTITKTIGYCVNCGVGECSTLENPWKFLPLVAHGYIRLVNIECECGSKKALFDIDVEDYIAYDISGVKCV